MPVQRHSVEYQFDSNQLSSTGLLIKAPHDQQHSTANGRLSRAAPLAGQIILKLKIHHTASGRRSGTSLCELQGLLGLDEVVAVLLQTRKLALEDDQQLGRLVWAQLTLVRE